MLGTLEPTQKQNWKSHIGSLVHAYNCTKHDTTGFSPYYLMFGRHPRIPVDLVLGKVEDQDTTSVDQYVASLQNQLKKAFEVAESATKSNQMGHKKVYDRKIRGAVLEIGDRVLLRNVGLKGTNKLADKWSGEVYVVTGKPNDNIPVYEVRLEQGSKKIRVVHRNLLLPLPWIPSNDREVSVTTLGDSMNTGLSDSSVDSSQTLDKATLTVGPFPVSHLLRMSMGRDIPTPALRGVRRVNHASAGTPSGIKESGSDSEEIDISSVLENSISNDMKVNASADDTYPELDSRCDFSKKEEVVGDGEIEEDERIEDEEEVVEEDEERTDGEEEVVDEDEERMNEEDLVLEVTSEEITEAEETDKEESFGSEVKTPQPAPRRSSRLRSKAHLDKDFCL